MTQFVDWELAAVTARSLGRSGPSLSLEEATAVVHRLRDQATRSTELVAGFTGLRTDTPAPVRVVDRPGWADANVAGLQGLLDPLAHKVSGEAGLLTRLVGSRLAGAQAGAVLGYLSGKVLGQFEVFGDRAGQLLLVAPNVVEIGRRLDVDETDFSMWVCLHEATHAAQFGAVPWLRDHFLSEITAFADASGDDGGVVEGVRRAVAAFADSIRGSDKDAGVLDLVTTPRQRLVVDRLTALMTLVEGHADVVMDEVGSQAVPSVATIRRRFDRRRESGGPLQQLIRRVLGMDAKYRQYSQGAAFTRAVLDRVGMDGFNRVWADPAHLPTMAEITDPPAWIERVGL